MREDKAQIMRFLPRAYSMLGLGDPRLTPRRQAGQAVVWIPAPLHGWAKRGTLVTVDLHLR